MDNDEKVLGEPEAIAENGSVEEQTAYQPEAAAEQEAPATAPELPAANEVHDRETPLLDAEPAAEAAPAPETEPEPAREAPGEDVGAVTEPVEEPGAEFEVLEAQAEPTEEPEEAVEEPEAAETPAAEGGTSEDDYFLQVMSGEVDLEGAATLTRGQIITGTIASKSDTEILVDVGAKSEGVIQARDLERLDPEIVDGLEVGQEIRVSVVTPEDRNGHPVLSLRRALEEEDWARAEEYLASKEVYPSKVTGFNKGGLIVPFGRIRGFVPASQVSMDRRRRSNGSTPQERWGGMVGEDINVKVIEVDRARNRLILSERAATQEKRAQRREELLNELEVGQVRKGRVVRLTDFGAFVDIGGADGLVHLSELSWRHVNHPKEVLSVGDKIEVEVISLDVERQRIGLSRKNVMPDPWEELAAEYHPGQLVQGKVTKLTKFGAFASLVERPEIEGLIHISELADHRVGHPQDVVEEGDVLTLRILRIEPDKRRLGLSLKRVDSPEYMDEDWGDFA